jgi:hypothetical protein
MAADNPYLAVLDGGLTEPKPPFGTVRTLDEAPAPANPYAKLLDEQDASEEQARKLTAFRATHAALSPDDAADVVRHAAATGLAPEFVADNLAEVRKNTSQAQLEQALARQPKLAQYMADAAKAPIVRDDVANLGPLEWLLTGRYDELKGYTPPAAVRAFATGIKHQQIAALGARQLAGVATPQDDAELRRLSAEADRDLVGAESPGVGGWLRHKVAASFVGGVQMLPYVGLSIVARTVGGFAGGAATGGVGAAVGALGGGAAFDFFSNVGGLYGSLRALRAPGGEPLLSEAEARSYAVGTSLATSVLTAGIGGKLVTAIPGVKELLAKVTGQSVAQAFVQRTAGRAALEAVKGYGEHVAAGATFMAVQAAANGATVEMAKATHGQQADWSAVRSVAADAFLHGARDMALLGAWAPGRQFLRDVGQSTRLASEAASLSAMTEAAKGSKLAERSPEEAQTLLGSMAREGDTPNVYVTFEAWNKLFQDDKGREAVKEVTGSTDAYDHAQATGGDLIIPTEAWLAKVARSKPADALREHVKLTADGLTLAQGKASADAIQKRAEALAKAEPVKGDEVWAIRERERAKALAAGADDAAADSFAALRAGNVQALAERYGGSAAEWYGKLGDLSIRGPKGELVDLPADPRPQGGGDVVELPNKLAQSAWEGHLSKDANDVTQEMTPLDVAGVGLPKGKGDGAGIIRVSAGEFGRTGETDPLAKTQEMTPLTLTQKERGYIEFNARGAEPLRAKITLLKGADRSTLAHETGHFLTEALSRLASAEGAPEGLRADMEALAKYAGYGSLEERSAGLNVAFEERISHAWETYLLEGKAPAAALAPVFARFKVWLTNIYEGVAGIARQYAANHDGELIVSDEARGIFDRWLASGHEVDAAKRAQEAQPFPVEHLKLDEKGTAAYAKALAEERQAAEATVLQHLAEAGKGAAKDFVIEERARIEGEVSKELDASPVQRLRTYLLEGHDPGAGTAKSIAEAKATQAVLFPNGEPLKLNRKVLAERYGEDFFKTLPRAATGKDGVHPDFLAQHFGFQSGDEMVRAFAASEPRDVVLERETQRRLQEAHPEDASAVADVALSTVHDDLTARRVLLEARALRRQLDPLTDPRAPLADLATLKATAAQLIAAQKVGDLSPSYYLQAERTAAKAALDAAAAGKVAEAYDAKEQQLLSMQMWRAARDAREQADSDVAFLRKFTDDKPAPSWAWPGPTTSLRSTTCSTVSSCAAASAVARSRAGSRRSSGWPRSRPPAATRSSRSVLDKLDKFIHWKELTAGEIGDLRAGGREHRAPGRAQADHPRRQQAARPGGAEGELVGRPLDAARGQAGARPGRAAHGRRAGRRLRAPARLRRREGRGVAAPARPGLDAARLGPDQRLDARVVAADPRDGQGDQRRDRLDARGRPGPLAGDALHRQRPALRPDRGAGGGAEHGQRLERPKAARGLAARQRRRSAGSRPGPRAPRASSWLAPHQGRRRARADDLGPARVPLAGERRARAEADRARAAEGRGDAAVLPHGRRPRRHAQGRLLPAGLRPALPRRGPARDEAAALGGIKLFDPGYYRAATPQGRLQARVESYARPIALDIDALPRKISERPRTSPSARRRSRSTSC